MITERATINTIKDYFKTNWKDMLSVLFFLVCYATSICLFLGGVADPTRPSDLEFPVFLPCAIADAVLIVAFVVLEKKIFKTKINIPLIIIMSCLFIVNLIVIVTTPIENTIDCIYIEPQSLFVVISNEYKVMYILCFLLLLMNIYISFNYLLFRVQLKKHFLWICSLIVLVGVFSVAYSYITEQETYKLFFENINTYIKAYNPKSFTNHCNSYAAILLGAGFSSFGLYASTKKKVFLIMCVFLCANIVFPMSRICLILSIVLFLSIFTYIMILSWKKHTFRNLNLVFLVVFFLILFSLIAFNDESISFYIRYIVFTDNMTGNSRKLLWECAISMIKGYHCFVGMGHGYFNTVFAGANVENVKMPHNLYLQTYCSLGILGLVLLAALLCFIVYKIVKLYKNSQEASLLSAIGLLLLLIYYVVEG